tara:strand:+ start:2248 stop:2472 length:225 start_codon:yes stop_codon:yes gene_type:complete
VLIHQEWTDSGKVYGYRKLHNDLRDACEARSENRVARLANLAGIAAQIGYKHALVDMAANQRSSPTTLWTRGSG